MGVGVACTRPEDRRSASLGAGALPSPSGSLPSVPRAACNVPWLGLPPGADHVGLTSFSVAAGSGGHISLGLPHCHTQCHSALPDSPSGALASLLFPWPPKLFLCLGSPPMSTLANSCSSFFFFYFFGNIPLRNEHIDFLKIYLFLAALGLHCCTRAFSSCSEQGLLFIAVRGLLIAVASLVVEHGL